MGDLRSRGVRGRETRAQQVALTGRDIERQGSCLLDVEFGILGDRSAKFWINVDIQRPPSLPWIGRDCMYRPEVHRERQTFGGNFVRMLCHILGAEFWVTGDGLREFHVKADDHGRQEIFGWLNSILPNRFNVNAQWRADGQVDRLVEHQGLFAVEMGANGGCHDSSILQTAQCEKHGINRGQEVRDWEPRARRSVVDTLRVP